MGQQHRKVTKRRRRSAYIKRQKEQRKNSLATAPLAKKILPTSAVPEKAEVVVPAVVSEPKAKKTPAKKTATDKPKKAPAKKTTASKESADKPRKAAAKKPAAEKSAEDKPKKAPAKKAPAKKEASATETAE